MRGDNWALGATLYNMAYKDQLVSTGLLNDVGNPVRVNVEDSYRRGLELEAGMQLTPEVRLRQCDVVRNKIANFKKSSMTMALS